MPPQRAATDTSASSSSVSAKVAGTYISEEPTPSAPCSMACCTMPCMDASWSAVGSTSSWPSTMMRGLTAPMSDETFIDTPFFSSSSRYSPSVVHSTGYRRSPCCARSSSFIAWLSGPIEKPSPMTCSVTPWRSSPWPRPSTSSDSVDQESMLMNPGTTALPVASISRRAFPGAFGPT
jgi:hypothetical protein